jgi:hypothetical protein
MKNKVFIGIDPAFRKKGFAIAILDEDYSLSFRIFDSFLNFFTFVLYEFPEGAIVGVENSNLQEVTFKKNATPYQHRSIGKNQAVSQLVADLLKARLGEEAVVEFSPSQKGKKVTCLKTFNFILNSYKFSSIAGYKNNKSEQDKRDAFKILELTRRSYNFKLK